MQNNEIYRDIVLFLSLNLIGGVIKGLKYIVIFLLSLVWILYVVPSLLVNIPFVQKEIATTATQELSHRLGVPVKIERVDIEWFNRLVLEGLYLEDQQGKVLFKANHVAYNCVEVEKEATYKAFCLQRGANIGRNETRVLLKDKGAKTTVNAAYMMNGWATLDTTTDVEHLSEETYSSQLIKGVVGGEARGVFQGKIHIAPHAVKTQGSQLHKALLLSDTAEIDVKPELEIFADDVKCSHGAASGELDEEQLFYMQSRGINREEAKQILIDAYLDDVISQIENENVKTWMKSFL